MICRFYREERRSRLRSIYCNKIEGRPGLTYWSRYCENNCSQCPYLLGKDVVVAKKNRQAKVGMKQNSAKCNETLNRRISNSTMPNFQYPELLIPHNRVFEIVWIVFVICTLVIALDKQVEFPELISYGICIFAVSLFLLRILILIKKRNIVLSVIRLMLTILSIIGIIVAIVPIYRNFSLSLSLRIMVNYLIMPVLALFVCESFKWFKDNHPIILVCILVLVTYVLLYYFFGWHLDYINELLGL